MNHTLFLDAVGQVNSSETYYLCVCMSFKIQLSIHQIPIHQSFIQEAFTGCLPISLVAQTVKNPPAMQETWVRSLGEEDPLEKGMDTHSSILAWRIPWIKEPGGLQSMGSQRV